MQCSSVYNTQYLPPLITVVRISVTVLQLIIAKKKYLKIFKFFSLLYNLFGLSFVLTLC